MPLHLLSQLPLSDWIVGGQKSSDSLARNWLAVIRSLLLTTAISLTIQAYPPDFVKASILLKKSLPGYENHATAYLAALLAFIALQSHWLYSVWLRCWRYWKKTYFAHFFIIAGVAIRPIEYTITKEASPFFITGWSLFGWALFFIATASLFWKAEEPSDEIQDKLQRSYFVERLMSCFLNPKTTLRRIAIMGGWGTGKTVVLRLIRQKLRKNKSPEFGVAMINPWASQNIEEVHAMLTRAFEEALGYRHYFNTFSRFNRWLFSLASIKLGGDTELGFDLQQLFRGELSSHEDQLVLRINETLRASGRVCVILVDDMERADPEVIRRVFPLIDVLHRIEHCFFVFGIDPARVARAFKERSASGEQTKGYLDKVFDLQLNLPQARLKDIASMCWHMIDPKETPKLHNAWDAIKSHLPETPREAIHFIRDAIMRETLFLSRYGPEEHDYIGFFKLRILALEKPTIVERINPQLVEDFRGARYAASIMRHRGQELDAQSQNKLDDAWNGATQGIPIDQSRASKLKSLFEEVLNNTVDLPWACHHHMRLLTLNQQQRLQIQQVWRNNAGTKSILEMIPLAAPNLSFDDSDQIATQLLETEISEYESIRGRLIGANSPVKAAELLRDALNRVGNLIAHVRFTTSSGLDRGFYPENFFNSWITLMFRGLLPDVQADTSELRLRERNCSVESASLLSTHDAYHFARFPATNIITRESIQNRRDDLISHIEAVRSVLQERLYLEVIAHIRSGHVAQPSFLGQMGVQHLAEIFGDLESWNPYQDALSSLRRLENDILDNPQIAVSMAAIAMSLLQAVGHIVRTGHGDRLEFTRETVANHPDYVALVWQMGLRSTSDREDLLLRRDYTRQATTATTSITTSQFDEAFPVDI